MKPSGVTYQATIQNLLDLYLRAFPKDRSRLEALCRQVSSGESELCNRLTLPGHLTGAALVFDSTEQKVLLIRHKFLERWLQPGGHLDPGEHPRAGALRDLSEEVGAGLGAQLHPWHEERGIPLDIDSHPIPANAGKSEPAHLHHDWLYIFTADSSARVTLQETEVSNFLWVSVQGLLDGDFGSRLQRVAEKLRNLELLVVEKGCGREA